MSKQKSENRTIDYLRAAISDGKAGLCDVPALIKRVIEEDLWQERYVPQTKEIARFDTFREFVETPPPEGLGVNLKMLCKLCADEPVVIDLIGQAQKNPPHGGDRRSQKFKSNNVTLEVVPRGNSVGYSLKRLRDHFPALHQKVLSGEMSVNQAMIDASLRRKSIYITKDVEKTASVIQKNFTRQEIDRLVKFLST